MNLCNQPRSLAVFLCSLSLVGWPPITAHEPPVATVVSFEEHMTGPFQELDTPLGRWQPATGQTIVDGKHAKTGRQCLQLTGGERTSLSLQIAEGVDTSGDLTFWAERWTSRPPFSFRIEKLTDDGWQEIYNGDEQVRVGRAFLNHVKVPLKDPRIQQLRFTCVSPPHTGILIDDVRIAPARPQRIVDVAVVPFTLPALLGNDSCPLLKLKVETTGQLDPLALTEMLFALDGTTDPASILSLQIRLSPENDSRFRSSRAIGMPRSTSADNERFVMAMPAGEGQLSEGVNYIWLAARLRPSANLDHRVGAACQRVEFSNGHSLTPDSPPSIQRLGIALRDSGDDGVHTFRIPGLATTNQGTLIGVYDVRRRSGRDLPGDIDVGMSRSTDGGRTWEPMKIIMDMGDDPQWQYDGIGDPAVLVDRATGTIWVAATWSHGHRSWHGSGPGLTPEETGQLMLVRSDDDGVTWSRPMNITSQVKRPAWCFLLQGPGKGITMRDGTLVFAAQYQDPPEQQRLPHSTILYSRDHGATWHVGTGAFDDTTEAQVVEVEPGVLMLNCRYNRQPARVVMTTRDWGQTWQKHPTSEQALIEPGACMASLIDVDHEAGRELGGWLLFSNPNSLQGRHHLTIKGSPDRGQTWPKQHHLLLDEGTSAGYTCLTMIDSQTVGILYEGSQSQLTFQRIPLSAMGIAR